MVKNKEAHQLLDCALIEVPKSLSKHNFFAMFWLLLVGWWGVMHHWLWNLSSSLCFESVSKLFHFGASGSLSHPRCAINSVCWDWRRLQPPPQSHNDNDSWGGTKYKPRGSSSFPGILSCPSAPAASLLWWPNPAAEVPLRCPVSSPELNLHLLWALPLQKLQLLWNYPQKPVPSVPITALPFWDWQNPAPLEHFPQSWDLFC